MDKLMEYICDELEELERKADKGGKLSMAEIQYADTLLHAKKNLLTAEAMMGEDEGGSYAGGSYARGRGRNARRDSMGRYSREGGSYEGSYEGSYARGGQGGQGGGNRGGNRGGSNAGGRGGSYERGYSRDDAKDELMDGLRALEQEAGDEETRHMVKKWMKQLEQE